MNTNILTTEVQYFINNNLNKDIVQLILKGSPFKEIPIQELANQIICKQRSLKKLPTWFSCKNIYFPNKVSIEQSSSEIAAQHKANLIKGDTIVDLTGGFGVDSYFFSNSFKNVIHCDINVDLSEIVKYNFNQLNVSNIKTVGKNGLEYLKETPLKVDYLYIDPSRRDANKNKVHFLNDCLPNVPQNIDFLFSKTDKILIKTSPLLDITSAINELNFTKEVHIIAIDNEVKELLFLLEKNYDQKTTVKTINIKKENTQEFNFHLPQSNTSNKYSFPKKYLYEPNVAILKSGGFHEIPEKFNVEKLHEHTHLYTSNELISFPGRRFEIVETIPYHKKTISKKVSSKKLNITTRNFPKAVAQLKKEFKINDGGNKYGFFTTLPDNSKVLIINNKIK